MPDWYPKRTLGMLPAEAASRWDRREALLFKGRRWSHAEFSEEVDRVAKALIAAGVKAGDHIALLLTNRPEFLFAFFSIIKVGAVVIPLNNRHRSLDLAYTLKHCECSMLIAVTHGGPVDFTALLHDVLGEVRLDSAGALQSREIPDLRHVVFVDDAPSAARARVPAFGWPPGSIAWPDFLAASGSVDDRALQARAVAVDPDGVAMIMYTSGTTGNPKGVMLGHAAVRMCTERAHLIGMTFADVQINYLPLFHLFSLANIALHCVLTGARHVLMESYDPDEILRMVEQERVTILIGLETHFRDLLAARARSPDTDLGSLRLGCFSAGQESSIETAIQVQDTLCPTLSAYGMTETWSGQTMTFLDDDMDKRSRASGFPLPGVEIRIVDPTGKDVAAGEQGEILQRSYCAMLGYFRDSEATARIIDADNWLHTGDAGLLRPDGHLRFLGRLKDMLRIGGENVAPAEIEGFLMRNPAIAHAAVIGAPDARLGEVPVAFVVARGGQSIDPQQLLDSCRGKLASFKIPRRVVIVPSLPMTPSGKVRKHELHSQLGS